MEGVLLAKVACSPMKRAALVRCSNGKRGGYCWCEGRVCAHEVIPFSIPKISCSSPSISASITSSGRGGVYT